MGNMMLKNQRYRFGFGMPHFTDRENSVINPLVNVYIYIIYIYIAIAMKNHHV